jgi:uncharacterized protein YdaU (DUF1376 family)
MNYYEHHLGDYMRDTAHLSMCEDGALRRLLDAYYVRERALPADLLECFKLARAHTKAERDAVAYVLKEFFQQRDEGIYQRRADAEIQRYHEKRRKAKSSAEARWNPRAGNGGASEMHTNGNASAMRSHAKRICETHALQSPVPSHQSPDSDQNLDRAAAQPAYSDEFETLKAIYPKRSGSQRWEDARRAINARLREGHTWQQILDGARRYADFCRHTGKERTETVLQAVTFFGKNKEFLSPYDIPATKAENQRDANIDASRAWLNGSH